MQTGAPIDSGLLRCGLRTWENPSITTISRPEREPPKIVADDVRDSMSSLTRPALGSEIRYDPTGSARSMDFSSSISTKALSAVDSTHETERS